MRAKIITIVAVLAVVVGLVVLIQFTASSSAPQQGDTPDPVRGDTAATVTIEEYGDFQCPACKSLEPSLKQVLQAFPGQVKLVFNDYPLRSVHPNAAEASEAGQCAFAQNLFWEYHDMLYQHQSEWSSLESPTSTFVDYATQLNLDTAAFQTCMDNDTTVAAIKEDEREGLGAKINSTPTLFVNGERLVGPSYEDLRAKVAEQLGQ
jgi:protein-disulfide isomerase